VASESLNWTTAPSSPVISPDFDSALLCAAGRQAGGAVSFRSNIRYIPLLKKDPKPVADDYFAVGHFSLVIAFHITSTRHLQSSLPKILFRIKIPFLLNHHHNNKT
jgi:hypothetical protein